MMLLQDLVKKFRSSNKNKTTIIKIFGLASVCILFLAGKLDRRDKTPKFGKFNFVKYPILGLGGRYLLLGLCCL
jgi:hypothetical protein